MLCLSLLQPWAQLLCLGAKQYETRSWETAVRGPVLIHASAKHFTKAQVKMYQNSPEYAIFRKFLPSDIHSLQYGAIIGKVDIVSTHKTEDCDTITDQERIFGDYTPGRYAFFCENPVLLENPVPAIGALNFWSLFNERNLTILDAVPCALQYYGQTLATSERPRNLEGLKAELLSTTKHHSLWPMIEAANKKLFNI